MSSVHVNLSYNLNSSYIQDNVTYSVFNTNNPNAYGTGPALWAGSSYMPHMRSRCERRAVR